MSELAPTLASWTRRVTGMYAKDLHALPEDAFTASPGGCARTPQDFTAEVAGMNHMLAAIIRGEAPSMPSEEERNAHRASLDSRDKGAKAVIASGEALASAIEAHPQRLGDITKAPWGEEMPIGALANIAANHVMYHDGQLNYYQSLKGDGAMHWFDE